MGKARCHTMTGCGAIPARLGVMPWGNGAVHLRPWEVVHHVGLEYAVDEYAVDEYAVDAYAVDEYAADECSVDEYL